MTEVTKYKHKKIANGINAQPFGLFIIGVSLLGSMDGYMFPLIIVDGCIEGEVQIFYRQ